MKYTQKKIYSTYSTRTSHLIGEYMEKEGLKGWASIAWAALEGPGVKQVKVKKLNATVNIFGNFGTVRIKKRWLFYCVGVEYSLRLYCTLQLARWLALAVATFFYAIQPLLSMLYKLLHGNETEPCAQPFRLVFRLVTWLVIGPSIFEDQQRCLLSVMNNLPCMRHVKWIFPEIEPQAHSFSMSNNWNLVKVE